MNNLFQLNEEELKTYFQFSVAIQPYNDTFLIYYHDTDDFCCDTVTGNLDSILQGFFKSKKKETYDFKQFQEQLKKLTNEVIIKTVDEL